MLKNIKRYNIPESYYDTIAYFIIVLGTFLRVILFLSDRSLMIDEANVARNLDERTFLLLFESLNYEQYVPPLFSVIVKSLTLIFGTVERALWALPFMSGIVTLLLFYRLCRHFLQSKYILYPLVVIAFSAILLEYSVMVKQYSSDTMTTIAVLLLCLRIQPSSFNLKNALLWAVAGTVTIWFSMPSIFVLAGIGIYYLISLFEKQSWRQLAYLLLSLAVWLASFSVYYLLVLHSDATTKHLQESHAQDFMTFPPQTSEEFRQFIRGILRIFTTSLGTTVLAFSWAGLCFILGLAKIWKQHHAKALLFFVPVIACLATSAMHLYSLKPRLILFLIPVVMLLVGKGTEIILEKSPTMIKALVIVVMIITAFNVGGYSYFYKPYEYEELKQTLNFLKAHKEVNEPVYVHHGAVPAFIFYTEKYKYKDLFHLENSILGKWSDDRKVTKEYAQGNKIWLVFTNITLEEKAERLNLLNSLGTVEMKHEVFGSSCYLYNFKAQ